MGKVMTPGSLAGVSARTLLRNERDVASIPPLGALSPILIAPMT